MVLIVFLGDIMKKALPQVRQGSDVFFPMFGHIHTSAAPLTTAGVVTGATTNMYLLNVCTFFFFYFMRAKVVDLFDISKENFLFFSACLIFLLCCHAEYNLRSLYVFCEVSRLCFTV